MTVTKIETDTLIVGAGLLGSSTAMHLAKMGAKDIRVLDFDLEGSFSSSELNAGGVRATMVQPVNILLSKHSIEFYEKNALEVGYRSCGYLWMHPERADELATRALARQRELGWPVEDWTHETLRKKIPFIDKTEGIGHVHFAPRDGLINTNLLKQFLRKEAKSLGVTFEDRVFVTGFEATPESKKKFKLTARKFPPQLDSEQKNEILTLKKVPSTLQSIQYSANRIVNCAGAWAPELAEILGYPCPSFPQRRQVCIFDCREVDLTSYGMMVDPSGVYFHPEATNGLAGFADPTEPPGKNYRYDGDDFFMQSIWPALYERSTAFEKLKHLTGWAGLYEVAPDKSAIMGAVKLGTPKKCGQIYEAHSFSGHGVMQCYAAGMGMAELMLNGRYQTLDLNSLSGTRFDEGKHVREELVI